MVSCTDAVVFEMLPDAVYIYSFTSFLISLLGYVTTTMIIISASSEMRYRPIYVYNTCMT